MTTIPSSGSAGYVNGMPMYAERIPARPSILQSGVPARLAALSSFCVPRFGFVVKLKMP